MGKKRKWAKVPILNDEYVVIVVFGGPRLVRRCLAAWGYGKVRDVKESLDGKRGLTFYSRGNHPVVAMPSRPRTPAQWGTLAHEACHAIEHLLDSIGQPARDEVMAHAVGAVVRIGGRKR